MSWLVVIGLLCFALATTDTVHEAKTGKPYLPGFVHGGLILGAVALVFAGILS